MTKLRKQRKRKVYRYDVNRKRLMKRMNRLPKIDCEQLSTGWDKKKSTKQNLCEMGLAYDPNVHIPIPSNKPDFMKKDPPPSSSNSSVVEELENEAKAPREKNFKLPKSHVEWLTKCLDKYGEDYEAMSKDRKLNIFQLTPNQIKSKMKVFKSIPEQYEEYLKKKEGESSTST